MEVLLSKNRYIKLFNSVYNKYSKFHRYIITDKQEEITKKGFKKIKTEKVWSSADYIVDEVKKEIEEFLNKDFKPALSEIIYKDPPKINQVRDFDQMWEFCQFVKYAEKCIFYVNDANNSFYVDSDMLSEDSATFTLYNPDKYRIKFKLELKHDSVTNTDLRIIIVEAERFYGRKMSNKFTIVNESVQFNDIADSLLIDVINSLLYDATYNTFLDIMKCLEEFFMERIVWETDKPSQLDVL